ncbi:MAG: sirohydrochlorin cobaltochelatase, partial [Synergistaceae bacterium]|nr:sirohydrochlorin cobaltochelatase [Synergistaceae bacterium]
MNKFFCTLLILLALVSACFAEPEAAKPETKAPEIKKENAILIISFGTSMPEARKAIDNLVNSAKSEFPNYEIRLAFTSNIIRRKLNAGIQNPVQALAALNDEGFKNVCVMPTHMIPGEEYDEILSVVSAFWSLSGSKYGFENLSMGTPFLNSVKDCERMAEIIAARFKSQLQDKDTAIVLMGHGTPKHHANALYSQLQL